MQPSPEQKKMASLLDEILDHQIANRGTENEYYKCYTYPTGEMPKWVKKAEKLLEKLNPKEKPPAQEEKNPVILQSGNARDRKFWVLEPHSSKTRVTLTLLDWSKDCIGEPGVMRRTTTQLKATKRKNDIYRVDLGPFTPTTNQIVLKTDRIEETPNLD